MGTVASSSYEWVGDKIYDIVAACQEMKYESDMMSRRIKYLQKYLPKEEFIECMADFVKNNIRRLTYPEHYSDWRCSEKTLRWMAYSIRDEQGDDWNEDDGYDEYTGITVMFNDIVEIPIIEIVEINEDNNDTYESDTLPTTPLFESNNNNSIRHRLPFSV